MDSNEYQVNIKSANQKVDDYVTKCNPNWTVHRLKQHISETHVNKPSTEEQRLIYAGNLLKDSSTLKQIFFRDSLCTELTNSSKTDFTIHLVCSSYTQKSLGSTNASGSSNSNTNSSATSSTNGRPPTDVSAPAPGDQSREPTITASSVPRQPIQHQPQQQLPQANVAPSLSPNTIMYSIPVGPITPLTAAQQAEMVRNLLQSDLMRHQMAVFQQLAYVVAAQLASNLANNGVNSAPNDDNNNNAQINQVPLVYMPIVGDSQLNQLAATSSSNHIATTTASQMLYNTAAGSRQQAQFVPTTDAHEATGSAANVAHQNENINNENNANQTRPNDLVAQMQAPPAPVVEQPPPQPAVDQDMMQRDVIDWVYYSVRAAVLMAALYIHASVFKLLFIVGLLAIAYFFNRRSTRRAQPNNIRQEQRAQQQDQLNVPAAQQVADNRDNAELRRRAAPNGGENPPDDNEHTEGAHTRQIDPQRVPILKLIYLVVTDFLASMVPD